MQRSYIFNTKTSINTDDEKSLWMLFRLQSRRQDKKWAYHVCCISCATILREWLNNKGRSLPFALPVTRREPTDHLTDWYFCIVPPLRHGLTKKDCQLSYYFTCYSNSTTHWRPPSSSTTAAVYTYFRFRWRAYWKTREDTSTFTSTDADFTADLQFKEFHLITQKELNDLIRDFDLPKSKVELLVSSLNNGNIWKKMSEFLCIVIGTNI